MKTPALLNVGCGTKVHPDWTNVDMHAAAPGVLAVDLLRGLPFPDDRFDVVYHSQVLEHFHKRDAPALLRECMRVLKPGGVLRIVVPDLEGIAREYLRVLEQNLAASDPVASANYDWIAIELLDQMVRDRPGGEMANLLARRDLPNEEYIVSRAGEVARILLSRRNRDQAGVETTWMVRLRRRLAALLPASVGAGRFRRGGEVHLWMYDRYSLGRLLADCGFTEVAVAGPEHSRVADWARYALDVADGRVFDPTSLFMEAQKPPRSSGTLGT